MTKLMNLNNTNKIIRHLFREVNSFKKGTRPASNLLNYNGELLSDFHTVLNKWKNYF